MQIPKLGLCGRHTRNSSSAFTPIVIQNTSQSNAEVYSITFPRNFYVLLVVQAKVVFVKTALEATNIVKMIQFGGLCVAASSSHLVRRDKAIIFVIYSSWMSEAVHRFYDIARSFEAHVVCLGTRSFRLSEARIRFQPKLLHLVILLSESLR